MQLASTAAVETAGRSSHRRAAAFALLLTALAATAPGGTGARSAAETVGVIVRATAGGMQDAAQAVAEAGGTVTRSLPIIGGFAASLPAHAIDDVAADSGVAWIVEDGKLVPLSKTSGTKTGSAKATVDSGSMSAVAEIVGAHHLWKRGYTGSGVDVALIDTGVTPVTGIDADRIVHGPDLSFDSQGPTPYLDQYGHGTHMAGIIAGRDPEVTSFTLDAPGFLGIAPEARIVNVKVGAFDGAADVSQVIAAIDWVVQHRADNGLNIRVLNLSFGTDSTQSYLVDPLAFAAEVAWRKGVFVVAASGNDGSDTAALAMPAANPFLFAVGAEDPNGTIPVDDDTIPSWAQRGDLNRHVDVVAPGVSVASLDVPGSYVNEYFETVHVGRFLRGSGTSQAAAVASGVAALVFDKFPSATPDQVKAYLQRTARQLDSAGTGTMVKNGDGTRNFDGYGVLDAKPAARASSLPVVAPQAHAFGTGLGSLELSRGSLHLEHDGVVLEGEQDIFGTPWDGQRWSSDAWGGTSWYGGEWNGQRWSGDSWAGQRWSGATWEADMWSGQRWSGQRWSGMNWDGQRWSGSGWDGQRWSGQRWSGQRWSAQRWSGAGWS